MMVGRTIDKLFPKQEAKLGEVVLEVKNLTTEPHSRDISFKLRAGEIVGLSGLVGSGRSETAQAIFGILPIAVGEIWVKGQKVNIRQPADALKHGIAYVPEDRGTQGLIKAMKLRENVSLASLKSISKASVIDFRQETSMAEKAIKQFSIRAYGPEQVTAKLSGGNQQKIVLGKWLERHPQVLIMDEPTRGVDVGAKSEIHRLMSQLAAEQGLAILMISSELPEILGMSDRILVMRQGSIVAEFTGNEASQEKIGAAMMSDIAKAPPTWPKGYEARA